MKAYQHLLISLMIGGLSAIYLDMSIEKNLLIISSAVLFGAIIDLDHLILARIHDGDWRNLREIAASPIEVYLGREDIDWFPVWMRYISHTIFVVILTATYYVNGSVYLLVGTISAGIHLLTEPLYDYIVRGSLR